MIQAIIDIGTNSILLLIAEWEGERLVVHRDEARVTRLGEGLHAHRQFSPPARARTLAVLEEYHRLCKTAGVGEVVVAGMSAFRRAANGRAFLTEIGARFGWRTRLLSGEEEAGLAYRSVVRDFPKHPQLIALDIGGGSTEVISEQQTMSFNLGTVILTEQHLHHNPPLPEELEALAQEVQTTLKSLSSAPSSTLVGLAGTVTTLSAVRQGLKDWTPERIQGSCLTQGEVKKWSDFFAKNERPRIASLPGMVKGREDTMLAGCLILDQVMTQLGCTTVVVSDRGVRYGLLDIE